MSASPAATESRPIEPGRSSTRAFRPEIQALRALAVLLVLVYHLWPARLTGGFIGVDVFFVISGYLITGHLWASANGSGLSLIGFYSRRIRRLAPASLLVLAVTLVGVLLLVPSARWPQFGGEAIGSALLVENWVLAASSIDYLAADQSASPFQHYWTLSVEEQFYLVWPLVILLVLALVRSGGGERRRRALLAALTLIGILSFAYSWYITAAEPAAAYFVTPARVWQFAAGGVLALVHARPDRRPALGASAAAAASWAGFAVILAGGLLLDGSMPYPGLAAVIPVVGTALVIAAGSAARRWAPTRFLGLRPVQEIGRVSFGIYLWHWPLIMLIPYATGHDLTLPEKLAVFVASIVLATLSTRFVEDPIRFDRRIAGRPLMTITAGVVAASLVAGGGLWMQLDAERRSDEARQQLLAEVTSDNPCVGAMSVLDAERCAPIQRPLDAETVAQAATDRAMPFVADCIDPLGDTRGELCFSGDADADRQVLLWGDSHAAAWEPAFDVAGRLDAFGVRSIVRQGCPAALEAPIATVFRDIDASEQEQCDRRNAQALDLVVQDESITDVVIASFSRNYRFETDRSAELVERLVSSGKRVYVLGDVPLTGADAVDRMDVPECLAAHLEAAEDCDRPRTIADPPGSLADRLSADPRSAGARFIEPPDAMCDSATCYMSPGGVPAYFDASHLSASYARTLGPWLAGQLDAQR